MTFQALYPKDFGIFGGLYSKDFGIFGGIWVKDFGIFGDFYQKHLRKDEETLMVPVYMTMFL